MANFASDNTAPVHPAILDALARANAGHTPAYGDDPWTGAALAKLHALVGDDCVAELVWNGTGANVTGLGALLRPGEGIVCAEEAHINVDECGAPERVTGAKLIDLPTPDGKLRVAQLEPLLHALGNEHHVQPRVISITQSTERGTVYTVPELTALAGFAHAHGMYLHVDGARIANATAALSGDLRATTRAAGVDVLSFGFTKNGGMGAEAVVFFDPALGARFKFLRKQGMQLASKMRYLAVQVEVLLTDGLWLSLAGHANAMARRLATGARGVRGVTLLGAPDANALFARLPDAAIPKLQARHQFYVWRPGTDGTSEVRWMCSWDTTEQDVDDFVAALREVLG